MRKKIAYAVFTLTDSGKEYMVQGNFGTDKKAAEEWAHNHVYELVPSTLTELISPKYRNGLFVKLIKY